MIDYNTNNNQREMTKKLTVSNIDTVDDCVIYLFCWNFDAHVSASDHEAIAGGDDLVDVLAALLVLQLWDDQDVLTGITQSISANMFCIQN
jgi:hypothetical protein